MQKDSTTLMIRNLLNSEWGRQNRFIVKFPDGIDIPSWCVKGVDFTNNLIILRDINELNLFEELQKWTKGTNPMDLSIFLINSMGEKIREMVYSSCIQSFDYNVMDYSNDDLLEIQIKLALELKEVIPIVPFSTKLHEICKRLYPDRYMEFPIEKDSEAYRFIMDEYKLYNLFVCSNPIILFGNIAVEMKEIHMDKIDEKLMLVLHKIEFQENGFIKFFGVTTNIF